MSGTPVYCIKTTQGPVGGIDPAAFDACELSHTPFQSVAWLRAWCRAFTPDGNDCFMVEASDTRTGRRVLMLPLVRERHGSLAILTMPDRGVTDYQAPIVAEIAPHEFRQLWRQLLKALPPADVVLIDKSPLLIGTLANPLASLPSAHPHVLKRHPLVLDADFATLRETRFNGTCMRSLSRKRRKLERKGQLEFSVVTGAEHAEALDGVLAWRARRFSDCNTVEKAQSERTFYRALLAEASIARLALILLDGVIIAGGFGVEDGGCFEMLCVAYDEAWKNYSPGLLLTESLIAWAVERGLGTFDFTIGSEGYKFDFGVIEERLVSVHVGLSLRGKVCAAMLRAHACAHTLRVAVSRLVARFSRPSPSVAAGGKAQD